MTLKDCSVVVDRRLADERLRSMPGLRLSNFDDPEYWQSGWRYEVPKVELEDMAPYELYPDPVTTATVPDLKCSRCNFEGNNKEQLEFHQASRKLALGPTYIKNDQYAKQARLKLFKLMSCISRCLSFWLIFHQMLHFLKMTSVVDFKVVLLLGGAI